MQKFNVGDKVRRTSKWVHGNVVHGGEYTVSNVRADGSLQLDGDTVYHYDDKCFELVVTAGELTDKEVFNAIVDGKPLQYRVGGTNWYNLKYPEKLTLLDVQRGTYRVRPTEVKLDCTVPYPEYSVGTALSSKKIKYSVDFATGYINNYGEADLPTGGVFWSSREQAEQFRDAVLASLQGK